MTTHTHYNEEKEKTAHRLYIIFRDVQIFFVLRLFFFSWRRFLVNFVVNFAVYLFLLVYFLFVYYVFKNVFYCRPIVFFQVSFGVCGLL